MKRFLVIVMCCLVFVCPAYSADTDNPYLTGEFRRGIYTNRAMGARAYFGDNWQTLSKRDVDELGREMESQSPTARATLDPSSTVFFAQTQDKLVNVNIELSNLGVMGGAELSKNKNKVINQYLDQAARILVQIYSEIGCKDVKTKRISATFLGKKETGLYITARAESSGISMNMYQKVIVLLRGEYAYFVAATSVGQDITDNILKMFRKIGS